MSLTITEFRPYVEEKWIVTLKSGSNAEEIVLKHRPSKAFLELLMDEQGYNTVEVKSIQITVTTYVRKS